MFAMFSAGNYHYLSALLRAATHRLVCCVAGIGVDVKVVMRGGLRNGCLGGKRCSETAQAGPGAQFSAVVAFSVSSVVSAPLQCHSSPLSGM